MAMSHLLVVLLVLLAPEVLAAGNVAVQWNLLVSQFVCTHNIQPTESNFLYLQVALAQWHALLALKDTGAGTTVEPAVVAYASRAVLAAYLTLEEDNNIDPLLDAQLRSMDHLTIPQKKLAQRLAESVALDVVERRAKDPRRTFTYGAARAAVDERQLDPTPGLFRFLNYTANKTLIIHELHLGKPSCSPMHWPTSKVQCPLNLTSIILFMVVKRLPRFRILIWWDQCRGAAAVQASEGAISGMGRGVRAAGEGGA